MEKNWNCGEPSQEWSTHPGSYKELRTISKELQVRVHDSTLTKRLGKNVIHGRDSRKKNSADQKEHKEDILMIPGTKNLRTNEMKDYVFSED